jgi:adenylylsulfate kinase-like enzyme
VSTLPTAPGREPGFTVWLTGIKGAGKGSVARALAAELAHRGQAVELLAGGEFRRNISQGLGFSREDRVANVRRIGYVARLLTRNGVAVVTTAISPYREARDECRQMIGRFVEVFVQAPPGPQARAEAHGGEAAYGGEPDAAGLTDPYERPLSPEVVLYGKTEPPRAAALRIVRRLEALAYLPAAGDPDEAIVRAQLKALQDR